MAMYGTVPFSLTICAVCRPSIATRLATPNMSTYDLPPATYPTLYVCGLSLAQKRAHIAAESSQWRQLVETSASYIPSRTTT